MVIAVPVGIGIAIFLTELCPRSLRRPIGIAIELLAGIPSIIYGIWGLFVFAPFQQKYIQPVLIDTFGNVPGLSSHVRRPALRHRHLHRRPDPVDHDPALHLGGDARCVGNRAPVLKEASYGLGCTSWEVMRNVVLPFSASAWSAARCWRSAAPWARPWPSPS